MRSLSRGFFTLCLALSAGFLLSVALRPRPPARTLPPHASRIRDLAFRFHVRPVLRGEAAPGNAGEWYRRAARLLLAGGGSDVLERFERGEEPDEDELTVWAGANREALDALRAGTRRAGSLLPVDWSEGSDAVVPEAGVGPSLAALAAAEAALAFRDERRLEAARILLDAARFGQDLARGGGVVHRLYAGRVEFLALRRLLSAVADGGFRGGELRALAEEAGRLRAGALPAEETLRAEAAFLLGDLGKTGEASGESEVLSWLDSASLAARKAGPFPAEAFAAADRAPRDGLPGPVRAPALARLADVERRVEALRRALLLALGLQIHRKALGRFPESLEAIAPVLGELPPDPFTGKPFGYRAGPGTGVELVSAGPDGIADGGEPTPPGLEKGVAGDWVFRLLGKG